MGSIKPEEPVAESSEGTAQSESTEILKQESTKDEDGVRLDEEQAALLGRLQLGDVDMDS